MVALFCNFDHVDCRLPCCYQALSGGAHSFSLRGLIYRPVGTSHPHFDAWMRNLVSGGRRIFKTVILTLKPSPRLLSFQGWAHRIVWSPNRTLTLYGKPESCQVLVKWLCYTHPLGGHGMRALPLHKPFQTGVAHSFSPITTSGVECLQLNELPTSL